MLAQLLNSKPAQEELNSPIIDLTHTYNKAKLNIIIKDHIEGDVIKTCIYMQAMQKLKDGEAVIAMDPRLRRTSASTATMENMLKLARRCLDPSRPSRPSMKTCGEELWGIRKEYRDRLLSSSCSESLRSAEFPVRNPKNNLYVSFGIKEDEDLYNKFISA